MFLSVECLSLLSDKHNYGSCTSFYSTLLGVSAVLSDDILSRQPKLVAVSNKSVIQDLYRVSQEERTKLREGVPYVKVHRYNPKHLYPKLNGYGDNGKRSLKL